MRETILTFAALGLARIRTKMLLLLVVLSLALLSVFAAAQLGVSYFSQESVQLPIALVNLDENETTAQLIQVVRNTPEVQKNYLITLVDSQQEGMTLVETNQVYACLVLPEDFLYSLQNGLNYPPLMILNSTQTADAQIMTALCDVLTEMVRQTQSGIYASTDFVLEADAYSSAFYLESNMAYITYVLDRSETYLVTDLPYESVLDLTTHYGLTLAIFLLLLSSALFYDVLNIQRDFPTMKLLSVRSHQHQTLYFLQLGLVYLLYFVLFLLLTLGLGGVYSPMVALSVANATGLFLLGQALLFQLVPHYLPAMLLSLILNSLALIAAGGILPTLLLPQWVATLSNAFPLTHIRTLLSSSLVSVERLGLLNLVVLSANWLLCSLLWNCNNDILAKGGHYDGLF